MECIHCQSKTIKRGEHNYCPQCGCNPNVLSKIKKQIVSYIQYRESLADSSVDYSFNNSRFIDRKTGKIKNLNRLALNQMRREGLVYCKREARGHKPEYQHIERNKRTYWYLSNNQNSK